MPKGQQQQGAGLIGKLVKAGVRTAKKQAKKELKKELRNPENKRMVKGAIKDAVSSRQQGGLVSLPVAVAAGAVAGIHPLDVAGAPLKMLPNGDFLPHPIDVVSMPLKLLPKIDIPHPLDLLNMPTQNLRQLAGDMNVSGRSDLKTKEQLIGGILITQEQQGGLVGGPLAAEVLPPIFPQ